MIKQASLRRPLLRADSPAAKPAEQPITYELRKATGTDNPEYARSWRISLTVAGLIVAFFIPLVFEESIGSKIFNPSCQEQGRWPCFSQQMKTYWPNVVQLMFFTIYADLGSTVRLAWQGAIGTLAVSINIRIMAFFFPSGGKCRRLADELLFGVPVGLRQMCAEYEDPNFATYEWLVWLDVLFVIILILGSNADDNTMKFALSWHVSFLMDFMSSSGDTERYSIFAVGVTTCLAVTLAIISMLLSPSFKLSNTLKAAPQNYKKDLQTVLAATSNFIRQSPSLSLAKRAAVAHDLEHRIGQLLACAEGFSAVHATTWWETAFGVGSYGKARRSFGVFIDCIGDSVNMALRLMLKAVLAEVDTDYTRLQETEGWQEFKEMLLRERGALTKHADAINSAVCKSVDCIINSSGNTNLSKEELDEAFEQIQINVGEIGAEKKRFEELAESLRILVTHQLKEPLHGVSAVIAGASDAKADDRDLSKKPVSFRSLHNNLLIYMYACMVIPSEAQGCGLGPGGGWPERWKARMTECMTNDQRHAHTWVQLPKVVLFTTLTVGRNGIIETWGDLYNHAPPWKSSFQIELRRILGEGWWWCPFWVRGWYDTEKRRFVVTNAFVIYLAFVFGNIFEGAVWTSYNATMASTLGVLISHQASSPLNKNFKRLLAIALGKVMPIMLIAFVALFKQSDSHLEGGCEAVVHLLVMFFYMVLFAKVYYTSPKWSTVACLVAGFGCYAFVSDKWDKDLFASRYQEVGQVTFAIFLQCVIDALANIIDKSSPRQQVADNLAKITGYKDEVEEVTSLLKRAFETCWSSCDEDALIGEIKGDCKQVGALIARQKELAEACEAGSIILPGSAGPFKSQLHSDCLALIEKLKVELDICNLLQWHVIKKSDAMISGGGHFSWNIDEIRDRRRLFEAHFRITFERLHGVLRHRGVTELREHNDSAESIAQFELKGTLSLPLCVARRVLRDIIHHLSQIDNACFSTGVLKTKFVDDSTLPDKI